MIQGESKNFVQVGIVQKRSKILLIIYKLRAPIQTILQTKLQKRVQITIQILVHTKIQTAVVYLITRRVEDLS